MKLSQLFRRKAREKEESRRPRAAEGGKRDSAFPSGEFRTLETMTPAEHGRELLQKWGLVKSDSGWWICRNDIPFLYVKTLDEGKAYLSKFNLECKDVDDRQRELTADDFRGMRETKMRMYDGLVK